LISANDDEHLAVGAEVRDFCVSVLHNSLSRSQIPQSRDVTRTNCQNSFASRAVRYRRTISSPAFIATSGSIGRRVPAAYRLANGLAGCGVPLAYIACRIGRYDSKAIGTERRSNESPGAILGEFADYGAIDRVKEANVQAGVPA
jgi:hypothetical protein